MVRSLGSRIDLSSAVDIPYRLLFCFVSLARSYRLGTPRTTRTRCQDSISYPLTRSTLLLHVQ